MDWWKTRLKERLRSTKREMHREERVKEKRYLKGVISGIQWALDQIEYQESLDAPDK